MNCFLLPLWYPSLTDKQPDDTGSPTHVVQCSKYGPFVVIKSPPVDADGESVDRRRFPYVIIDREGDAWFGGSKKELDAFLDELNTASAREIMIKGTAAEGL